jgi:hypothetical protein
MNPSDITDLLLVPLIAGGAVFGDFAERAFGPMEQSYKAGETVSGKNKGYAVTIPDGSWLSMPADRRATDADLELTGLDGKAILTVFAGCDRGATLDLLVDYRRGENADRLTNLEVDEDRRFDTGSFVPVSVARYTGLEKAGHRETYWISSAVDGRFDVEVIVTVFSEEPEDEQSAQAIAESLEIRGEEAGCASG